MRRAVFLDRDGVINAMVYHAEFGLVDSPSSPGEFRLLDGVAAAVRQAKALGFLTIVISNQPGVAKGKFTMALLEATNEKMQSELAKEDAALDAVYYCLHHPEALLEAFRQRCECRKPRPGMLLEAADDWELDLGRSYFVGDGVSDVLAGKRAGCNTILLSSRKCYLCDELARQKVEPDYMATNLADAMQAIAKIEMGDVAGAEQYRFLCRTACD